MIWFEALPSPGTATGSRRRRDLELLAPLRELGVERILVPEVLDGDHQTVDNVEFASAAASAARLPATAAVCLPPRDVARLETRAAQAADAGIDSLLLVGATSRRQPSTGPSVEEAIARLAGPRDLGVVTIPARRRWRHDEPHRLLRKQRAGASFCVSQILFEPEEALRLRRAFLDSLAPGERPLPVIYSLAPVRRATDLAFLHRLGVHVPAPLERELREATPQTRPRLAQEAALRVAGRLARAHEEEQLGPYGFCVSHVMVQNVGVATNLAAALHERLVHTVSR